MITPIARIINKGNIGSVDSFFPSILIPLLSNLLSLLGRKPRQHLELRIDLQNKIGKKDLSPYKKAGPFLITS